ncbi:MAG: hypothetical protein C4570_02080 [Ammonifex sp.]|nr:MAG: hypothetical protein C4570_02080 [Ammonifex sp.]
MSQPASRKKLVREHFYLFWWYYFPHYHNRQIPEYKKAPISSVYEMRLLDIEPREHGKSVVWSCGYPLWVMLTNPYSREVMPLENGMFRYAPNQEEEIIQISYAGALPRKWIRRHKAELSANKPLIADWGYQSSRGLGDGIWTSDEIRLRNLAHCFSLGSGSQARGQHPTIIIIDDLEDRERSQNPELRAKDKEYFYADVFGLLKPDSRLFVVGTIVHQDSLLANLHRKEIEVPPELAKKPQFSQPWTKFRFQALLPDNKPLAPEVWSYEHLLLRKAEIPPSVWRSEFMNDPESGENPIFPRSWFRPDMVGYRLHDPDFQERVIPKLRQVFSFVDPACEEGEMNDYTAIVTVGLDNSIGSNRVKIYVLEIKMFRASLRGQLTEALNTWLKWKGLIGFEAIQYQSMLAKEFGAVCDEQHIFPQYYTTNYREKKLAKEDRPKALDKASRAHRVTHFFEMGNVYFDFSSPMTERLIDQLTTFTGENKKGGEHDDGVDALVGCLWKVQEYLKTERREKAPSRVNIDYDPDTGAPRISEGAYD